MKLIFFKKKNVWVVDCGLGFCKISMFVFKNFLLEINIENCRKKKKVKFRINYDMRYLLFISL